MFKETVQEIKEISRYRELLKNLVIRDIKIRYKRSVLGFIWVMLNPLLMMIVYYLVFSALFEHAIDNYVAYIITGITVWQLYGQSTARSTRAFFESANIMKKKALPRSIFPLSIVMSAIVNFLFSLVPMFAVLMISGASPIDRYILFMPLGILFLLIFSYGIALLLSTMTVFFHDTIYIYDVLLLALMFLSAIFYPVKIIPEKYRLLVTLNPLYHYITLFRACIYDSSINVYLHLRYAFIYAIVSMLIGWTVYYTNRNRIIFYL